VFAHGLYGKTNKDLRGLCPNTSQVLNPDTFPDDNEIVDADLYKAGVFLGCAFGLPALYVWAVGIFAAGQSSTMTGTYAGQFVMEGFLNLHWSRWKRVLLTRALAIAPTLSLAISVDSIDDLTGMNDLLNVLMSLMLPFALLPLMIFSASDKVMKSFRTNTASQITLWFLSTAVICINLSFVSIFVHKNLSNSWFIYLVLGTFFLFYISFILYLIGCLMVVLNYTFVLNIPLLGPYMSDDYILDLDHQGTSSGVPSYSASVSNMASLPNYSSIN